MSGTYNKVFLIGRIGQDPELRYTQSGTAVTNFSLATDDGGKDNKKTEWHRIMVWDKQAETVCQYMSKGRLILVEGSLQTRKWQDKQGQDRYTTEIKAQRVVFMGSGSGNREPQNHSQGAGEPQPGPGDGWQEDGAPF